VRGREWTGRGGKVREGRGKGKGGRRPSGFAPPGKIS